MLDSKTTSYPRMVHATTEDFGIVDGKALTVLQFGENELGVDLVQRYGKEGGLLLIPEDVLEGVPPASERIDLNPGIFLIERSKIRKSLDVIPGV